MSRTIFCTFLQREAEGQDFQLYPGELGKRIYNEISKEAWAQWQHKQTMLINEKISRAGFDCAVAHLLFDDQKRRYL